MFKELDKYTDNKSFTFKVDETLGEVCTAPHNKSGIYLVFEINKNTKSLIYIGSSGHIRNDGSIHVRTSGLKGMKDRIVNGHQFNKQKRYISWPKQMKIENINKLEIHWYVTHSTDFADSPCFVEYTLLQKYYNLNKRLPKWNKKF